VNFQEGLNQIDQANQLIIEANQLIIEAIMNAFLFTWQWWIGFSMLVVPWIVWVIFRKKESTGRLLLAGFVVMVMSTIMDSFGVAAGKWSYPIRIVPSALVYFPFRFGLLPVLVMFFLQIKPTINPFLKAVIFGLLGAYVGMPIMAMIDLYKNIDWAYTYSFFILTGMYLIAYWFSDTNKFEKI
jgi:hypothetical protein